MSEISDKELDEIISNKEKSIVVKEKETIVEPVVNLETAFANKMDKVKENILVDASATDDKFVDTVKQNVKEAAVRLTEIEKEKADLQGQQVEFESDKITTKQKKEKHQQTADTLEDKKKRRQFHFDGVKPIMNFVNITEPMNLFFLYFLAALLTPLFLIAKLCKGSFGALLTGANDSDRGKAAKGFLWTLLCILSIFTIVCLIYLFLKGQGIDIFAKIK